MPWFSIQLQGVDQGNLWFATNEEEVLQNFVRIKGGDLEKNARSLGLDAAQYRKAHVRIKKERD
jgi:hypothetical protein